LAYLAIEIIEIVLVTRDSSISNIIVDSPWYTNDFA
jgi:hypothetical protein